MARAALEARCLVVLTAARQWQDESHPRLRFCLSNPYSLISLQRLRFDLPHSDFSQGPLGGRAVIDAQRPTESPRRFSAEPATPFASSSVVILLFSPPPVKHTPHTMNQP